MQYVLAQPNLQFSEPALWEPAVDLDGGARFSSNSIGWGAVYRAGLGIFLLRGSRLFSGTSTVSRTPSKRWILGVQGETVWTTSGLGISVGADMSTEGDVAMYAGPSFSLLHLAGQIDLAQPRNRSIALYLRIPVGLIARVLLARPLSPQVPAPGPMEPR